LGQIPALLGELQAGGARVVLAALAPDQVPGGKPVQEPDHSGVAEPDAAAQFLDGQARVVGDLHESGRCAAALGGRLGHRIDHLVGYRQARTPSRFAARSCVCCIHIG
jgi:hypothetical protein